MSDRVHLEPVIGYDGHERAERERRRFFRDEPLVLALSCDVARPGDFVTHDLTGVPILLARTRSGHARAFVNVCRHRGARVVEGSGCGQQSFACPYHAWTYDCDGRLLGMGTTRGFEGVDRAHHGLTALPVLERHGLIWVRPVPGPTPDADALLQGMGDERTRPVRLVRVSPLRDPHDTAADELEARCGHLPRVVARARTAPPNDRAGAPLGRRRIRSVRTQPATDLSLEVDRRPARTARGRVACGSVLADRARRVPQYRAGHGQRSSRVVAHLPGRREPGRERDRGLALHAGAGRDRGRSR